MAIRALAQQVEKLVLTMRFMLLGPMHGPGAAREPDGYPV
jgi:hypothetical protein